MASQNTFSDFRTYMTTEDLVQHGGQYGCDIKAAFFDRQIGGSPVEANISGDVVLNANEQGLWASNAQCADGAVYYEWSYREAPDDQWLILFGENGSDAQPLVLPAEWPGDISVQVNAGGYSGYDEHTIYVNNSYTCDGDGGGGFGFQANATAPADEAVFSSVQVRVRTGGVRTPAPIP